MNYSGIKYNDMINGKGIRVSLFVSGCSHACKGCFNQETWNKNYGKEFTDIQINEIINYLTKYKGTVSGLSLLGGDPTYKDNIEPLCEFINKVKEKCPWINIWIWSGYTFEEILLDEQKLKLIKLCDVLIDGKFILEQKSLDIKWRGSTNQRVINIQQSLQENKIIIFE
jgi:anaerobic ribonucleoside-triphosphate reductase activating protein